MSSVVLSWLSEVCLVAAAIPAALFAVNFPLFRRPVCNPKADPVSVLIPARNEELAIAAAMQAVLASRGVELELLVLDDSSTDRTAELAGEAAAGDSRVRLESAPPLPDGWNGKQHACWALASMARFDTLCFLDADVRLGPEALCRMLGELARENSAMVSGFPRQETVTFLEWLLLPLIHFVLLGFLPLPGERWSQRAAFAAGCGQFMMVRKDAYFASGGHAAIRTTMHDGLLLPRLFRRHGHKTRVYDLSQDALCRMYRAAGEVWRGLSKNATEGMAAPGRIPVFTVLLLAGQVLPIPLAAWAAAAGDVAALDRCLLAALLGYTVRFMSSWRYRQSWRGALLHPVGVLVTLALQWSALTGKIAGRTVTWKARAYPEN